MKHILGRVQVTRKCNQECVFCAAPASDDELTMDEIKTKIDELKSHGTTDLMITGGEPTLRDDLIDILRYGADSGFPEMQIQTNGTSLDPERLRAIRSLNANIGFNVSLDTHKKSIYGKITGHPENFKKLITCLKDISRLNMHAYPTVVISSLNYRDLPGLMMFIGKELSYMKHISLNYIDPRCRALENPWTVPRYSETELHILRAVHFMLKNGMTFRLERVPLCYMNGFEEFSSDIRRDIFDEKRLMSFLKPEDKISDQLFIEKRSMYVYAPQCKICYYSSICPGINPDYVRVHGDTEVYPVFADPSTIIKRAKRTKS